MGAGSIGSGDEVTFFERAEGVLHLIRVLGGVELEDERIGRAGVLHIVFPAANAGADEFADNLGVFVDKRLASVEDAIWIVSCAADKQCAVSAAGFGYKKRL